MLVEHRCNDRSKSDADICDSQTDSDMNGNFDSDLDSDIDKDLFQFNIFSHTDTMSLSSPSINLQFETNIISTSNLLSTISFNPFNNK